MQLNTRIGIDTYIDLTGEGKVEVSIYTEDGDNEIDSGIYSLVDLVDEALSYFDYDDAGDLEQLQIFLSSLQYEIGQAAARVHEESTRLMTGAYDGRD